MANERPDWFTEEAGFFGPRYILEYESDLPPARTMREVDFIERRLGLKPGAKILDMPCGHGRHAIALAKRGYELTGIDLNNFFLRTARAAAEKEGVKANFLQGDMREISFADTFDVALNMFTGVGYFETDDEDQKIFDTIGRSLRRGGLFLIDFNNHDRTLRNLIPQEWRVLSDRSKVLIERDYDALAGKMIERRVTIFENGQSEKVTSFTARMYTPAELLKMGRAAGLQLKESYGDFEGGKLSMDSKRAILIFAKP